ncbi:hypothetical protein ZHAS_00016302 [Anopheles sinensis]|uniref:Uncharacterized protein n=1 Tax=Anopheles sinensis TaxID=74873 RepID=A0A084WDM6_ANOSI|nr:hypothetical protein ZHAS_00016302 [Anopheles sinensis]
MHSTVNIDRLFIFTHGKRASKKGLPCWFAFSQAGYSFSRPVLISIAISPEAAHAQQTTKQNEDPPSPQTGGSLHSIPKIHMATLRQITHAVQPDEATFTAGVVKTAADFLAFRASEWHCSAPETPPHRTEQSRAEPWPATVSSVSLRLNLARFARAKQTRLTLADGRTDGRTEPAGYSFRGGHRRGSLGEWCKEGDLRDINLRLRPLGSVGSVRLQ